MIEALITGLVVAAAAAYIGRSLYRAARGKSHGCGHCGSDTCASEPKR